MKTRKTSINRSSFRGAGMHALTAVLCLLLLMTGCSKKDATSPDMKESQEAKALLQGIWVDDETENVVFKVLGDTVFYPDSTSQPAYFKIVADTMILGESAVKYPLVKQMEHIFWFINQNGDTVKLVKSNNEADSLNFTKKRPEVLTITDVTKRDTVVTYDNERYHCYVAINPTKYQVTSTAYTDDGVEVSNVYYDNIVHLSVFHGNNRLFGKNFQKMEFTKFVPKEFLEQAILSNVEYDRADADGFHFDATLCTPNAASCYMVEIIVSFKAQVSMKLLEN